ncbi:hypothetical protein [Bradyrhizobium stylosanthis]|uniref:hypothetical protein n=1 Tax=Bradyrhizobium stylosanthis TaxID=1803665 RepID=UPI000A89F809|nr:hypothetical protein [Bradyrhizobium stylosanthis]
METPPSRETVIIVHGTWAAPVSSKLHWYQSGSSDGCFVSKLDKALQARGSIARCWAHCDEGTRAFHWSGENSWVARTKGADALGDYVHELQKAGWLCHVVAHSHGGNVLIEALPKIDATEDGEAPTGRLVTLGTPFMDVTSPVLENDQVRREILLGLGIMLIAMQGYGVWAKWALVSEHPVIVIAPTAVILAGVLLRWRKRVLRDSWSTYFRKYWTRVLSDVVLWTGAALILQATLFTPWYPDREIWSISGGVVLLALMFRWRWNRKRNSSVSSASATHTTSSAKPQMLALSSRIDEAWQVLHHLRVTKNPLAAKDGLLRYLISSLTSSYIQRAAADRLNYSPLGRISVGPAIGAAAVHLWLVLTCYMLWSHRNELNGNSEWHPFLSMLSTFLVLSITSSLLFGDRFIAAYLFPFRWISRTTGAIANTVVAVGTYAVRRAAWQLILRIAMGLEGYQFPLPAVEQCPRRLGDIVKYEDISPVAQAIALNDRSAWVARHLLSVSETFAKVTVTGVDVQALLRTIEADQTLVHAAYYTHDECIERIADWIALGR